MLRRRTHTTTTAAAATLFYSCCLLPFLARPTASSPSPSLRAPTSRWITKTRGGDAPLLPQQQLHKDDFQLLKEFDHFRGKWRSIMQRDVKYPDGRVVNFDIMDQPGSSVMVFIFNTTSQTSTLIEEYAPGSLDVIIGPVAGGVEDHKHTSSFEAAQHELEEEAHLVGGTWHCLLASEETKAPADKYSTCPFSFYLVVDPEMEHDPKPHDEDELLVVHRGVTVPEVKGLIREGKMTVPAACASLLAIDKIRELGLLKRGGATSDSTDASSASSSSSSSSAASFSSTAATAGDADEGEQIIDDEDGAGFTFPSEQGSGKRVPSFNSPSTSRSALSSAKGEEEIIEDEDGAGGFSFPSEAGSGKRTPSSSSISSASKKNAAATKGSGKTDIKAEEGFSFPSEEGSGASSSQQW